jgi:hypothetical protein
MSSDECSICFEAFTPDSGHSVLGCGHKFHLMCVVRWFQDQEGASTCPFCRREAGHLDNVPLIEEVEEEDDADEEGDSDWDGEEGDEEEEEIGDLRAVWTRNEQGGFWERTWVVTGGAVMIWDPSATAEAEEPPEEMVEGAVALQRIWRGWSVRRHLRPPPARDEEDEVVTEAARIMVTLQTAASPTEAPVNNWHYQRFVRVD